MTPQDHVSLDVLSMRTQFWATENLTVILASSERSRYKSPRWENLGIGPLHLPISVKCKCRANEDTETSFMENIFIPSGTNLGPCRTCECGQSC